MADRVAIQMFAYGEDRVIRPTMDGYARLDIPPGVDVDLQAWVTPTRSGRTVREVRQHHSFNLWEAPEGKLDARNAAHDKATRDGYDIIVTADADEPPMSADYLHRLVQPIRDGGAVATTGFPKDTSFVSPLVDAWRLADQLRGPIRGNTSAFTIDAWRLAGPLDTTNTKQSSIDSVRSEEEFQFRRRLSDAGRVEDVYEARTVANNRRNLCKIQDAMNPVGDAGEGYCGRRGTATFDSLDGRNDK